MTDPNETRAEPGQFPRAVHVMMTSLICVVVFVYALATGDSGFWAAVDGIILVAAGFGIGAALFL